MIVLARSKQLYADNGVELSKSTISVGDEVTLFYSGLLAKCGADSVYAHIGYGDNWEDKSFIPMEKVEDVFRATIKVSHPEKLNIAFKDSIDNWDNNSQQNYTFNVSTKASKSSASKEKKASAKVKASSTKSEAVKEASETKTKTAKAKSASSKSTTKSTAKKTSSDKTSTTKKSAAKKNSK